MHINNFSTRYYISDFITIQRQSFFDLLETGIIEEFHKRNPITNLKKDLEIFFYPEYYRLTTPEYSPQMAIIKNKSYTSKLFVPVQFTCRANQQIFLKWFYIGNLPLMTKRGHFILNGGARVIVNQILRSPGLYYQQKVYENYLEKWSLKPENSFKRYYADLICMRGTWLRIEMDKDKNIWAQMKKGPKIPIYWFLLAMGLSEKKILKTVKDSYKLIVNLEKSNSFLGSGLKLSPQGNLNKEAVGGFLKKEDGLVPLRNPPSTLGRGRLPDPSFPLQAAELGLGGQASDRAPSEDRPVSTVSALSSLFSLSKTKKEKKPPKQSYPYLKYPPEAWQAIYTLINKPINNQQMETWAAEHRREARAVSTSSLISKTSSYLLDSPYGAHDERKQLERTSKKPSWAGTFSGTSWSCSGARGLVGCPFSLFPEEGRPTRVAPRKNGLVRRPSSVKRGLVGRPRPTRGRPTWALGGVGRLGGAAFFGSGARRRKAERLPEGRGRYSRRQPFNLTYSRPGLLRCQRGTGALCPPPAYEGKRGLDEPLDLYLYRYGSGGEGKTNKKKAKSEGVGGPQPQLGAGGPRAANETPANEGVGGPQPQLGAGGPRALKIKIRREKGYTQSAESTTFTYLIRNEGRKWLYNRFLNPRSYDLSKQGRLSLNRKLGLNISTNQSTLTGLDVLYATDYLIRVEQGLYKIDDIDHLKNRRVRTSGELIQIQIGVGLVRLEKSIRDALNKTKEGLDSSFFGSIAFLKKTKKVNTNNLSLTYKNKKLNRLKIDSKDKGINNLNLNSFMNIKAFNSAIREFFGTSPLSQFMDQINPLAELTHKRRLSSMGPGGVTRDTATLAIRGIHPTHYGRICPIETPEGKNTGLVNSMTTYARVNKNGILESPFYKVYKGQVQKNAGMFFFSAEQEEKVKLAAADLYLSNICFLPKSLIPVRIAEDFTKIPRSKVQYMGVSPLQMISIAASLIPFLEHDDANRALMGSNMQRQAVPLIRPERPIVGTGLEARAVSDSGHAIISKYSGFVSYVSSKKIIIYA
uniref:DNA-directed RNA polymerase n=1 Tax=Haematococcus lacustris TaxID=44745 RepID=A0A2K9YRR5_HAELA|nr:DNA-directed RNA polymerase subunit beta [Haematococcus lacustris]AUW36446.1 DNA-directed RNA polymerase subunit beta [Haematococcus lacustris]